MKSPIRYRKSIPFYCEKSESAFQKDIYERYDDMVVRQTALHLADDLWGYYPLQPVLDFGLEYLRDNSEGHILELGCGVGRWIGSLAQKLPLAKCWGIDYSYQMLKRAREFWIEGKVLEIDLSNKGFLRQRSINGFQLGNLQFGLAKASDLPFEEESQDLVLSSFLLDRLDNPEAGLREMYRVLRQSGRLILITPFNFNRSKHWQKFYPSKKLTAFMKDIGFKILDQQGDIIIQEPLDFHGNLINWKCLGVVAEKTTTA